MNRIGIVRHVVETFLQGTGIELPAYPNPKYVEDLVRVPINAWANIPLGEQYAPYSEDDPFDFGQFLEDVGSNPTVGVHVGKRILWVVGITNLSGRDTLVHWQFKKVN